jgi:hypothetical protein
MDALNSTLNLSRHAVLRMAQRNISIEDLLYVLKHGERVHRTGVTMYILRKRDILQKDRRRSEITRLEGTAVLTGFSQDGKVEVITIYRNKGSFRTFRGKKKYDYRRKYRKNRNLPLIG